jgi:starch synthase
MPARPVRILMVSSEVESLARTGGLGDVVAALSRALGGLGADVVIVTPRYGVTREPPGIVPWAEPVVAPLGLGHARRPRVLEARFGPGVRVCLLRDPELYDRQGIYGDAGGTFGDNAFRFAAMSSAALAVAERVWRGALPDILHAHDWHAALALIYARMARGPAWARVRSALTIHNLAFQGVTPPGERDYLAIPHEAWDRGWIRHDGAINLMKGGIEVADRVTAVSETYAREIQRWPNGYGLEPHLQWHSAKVTGIVNGIDVEAFDPATDRHLARNYGPADAVRGRLACKRALCAELGLDPDGPLFGSVSRLQWLKGIDLLVDLAPVLVDRGARLALVGAGDPGQEAALRAAAARWPGRVAARVGFEPDLARRVFAGADFFAVPSRDEPCGLTQMYAMRYGSLPVVTAVGGLRDTVTPIDGARGRGTGIVAERADHGSLLHACEQALSLYRDRAGMESAIARAMARDSSWASSARRYMALYDEVLRS